MDSDFTPFINAGIPGLLLLWFMLRLERILNRYDKTLNLMARAIIRQLERHEPEAASELSKELYSANGETSRRVVREVWLVSTMSRYANRPAMPRDG